MGRLSLALLALALAGCEVDADPAEGDAGEDAAETPPTDAAAPFDMTHELPPDAAPAVARDGAPAADLDGALPDAAAPDGAADPTPDGATDAALDAAMDAGPDAAPQWGPCSVDGVPGDCRPVTECVGDETSTPGLCPGPADIQCCTPPGGAFACDPQDRRDPNAGLAEPPGLDGCPAGMAPVADFCVDRWEASLEGASPYHNPGDAPPRAVSRPGAVPQGYIDGRQAGAACAAAGKRLCTDVEWLRACQGPDAFTWPYGPQRMPGVCNDSRARHPAVELFPDDPTPFDRIQDACINQLPDGLALTGDHAGCESAEGLFDLAGNLHEWTADPEGTFRGGFYVDTAINGPGCLYRTTAHDTGHWDYSTGFRCCADRQPPR